LLLAKTCMANLACEIGCREQFQVDLQPEWVYELDSSHTGKFSRHLILRIPGTSFVNNWAVGHLVSQILAEPEVNSPQLFGPDFPLVQEALMVWCQAHCCQLYGMTVCHLS